MYSLVNLKEINMHYEDDEQYDTIKDDMALCQSNEEALELAARYPSMTRFLDKSYRYYLYTVACRHNNRFPKCIQLWEHELH